jgi:hypothetical protein
MDAFAAYQIAREFDLTTHELAVLINWTMTAPWRSMVWKGTISATADDTRMTRRTATKAATGLKAKGAIVIREPFRQGEFGHGTIDLPLYPRMVKLSHLQQQYHAEAARSRAEAMALQTRSNRGANALDSRSLARLPNADQASSEDAGIRQSGNEGVRDEEDSELETDAYDWPIPDLLCRWCDERSCDCEKECRLCGDLIGGHSFDHEPVPAGVAS